MRDELIECIWVEKYRPNSVSQYICTNRFSEKIKELMTNNQNHLIFESNEPGTGKTSLAKILANEVSGENQLKINGSEKRGIDVVRGPITRFAEYMAMDSKRKTLIIDEADRLTAEAQDALKTLMEERGETCRFIFTCNRFNMLIDALRDRCETIQFREQVFGSTKEEHHEMMNKALNYLVHILEQENIEPDIPIIKNIVRASFVNNFFHFRHAVKQLYIASRSGQLVDLDFKIKTLDVEPFISAIKSGNQKELVYFVKNNSYEWFKVLEVFYADFEKIFKEGTIANVMILLAAYQDYINQAVVKEIPLTALAYEIKDYLR